MLRRLDEGVATAEIWGGLLAQAQAGDRDAYRMLLEAIVPHIRGIVRKGLREPADCEDVVQDILIALHTVRHTYDPKRPFKPWLGSIVRHRVLDRQRTLGRRNRRETELKPVHESYASPSASNDALTADGSALHAALRLLPVGQRQAVELTKLRELSLKEASAISGLSVAALKVATHRGLMRLRGILVGGIEGT